MNFEEAQMDVLRGCSASQIKVTNFKLLYAFMRELGYNDAEISTAVESLINAGKLERMDGVQYMIKGVC